ncbi:class I SAM-dependent methyltransferase [Patescibacteria group bacterium]|nr:class I SAM-dependent methyltransferase [Patescibacteria group bacterium]MBU1721376.1 class I SAM-dependent methyltransferase [Patescibacteria group bacterium]MBU1900915.1 class I SAM-dependent methyltransferase [Patescibacteria group bacterium]
MSQTGNFGKLVNEYDKVRPRYASKIMKLIFEAIEKQNNVNPLILDLACGTGIATRQIAKKMGTVIGCDIDEEMIHAAVSYKTANASYVVGSSERLPFRDNTFDIITIFTAFHWFSTKKAMKEIKRVLKEKGSLCIIQPRHVASFSSDLRNILAEFLNKDLTPKYGMKDFETVFIENGLTKYVSTKLKVTDKFSLEDYLTLIQSYSVWNEVPEEKKKEALQILKKHYKGLLVNEKIHDKQETEVIVVRNI